MDYYFANIAHSEYRLGFGLDRGHVDQPVSGERDSSCPLSVHTSLFVLGCFPRGEMAEA